MDNYSCELCGISYREREERRDHMRERHLEEAPRFEKSVFECSNCSRSFPSGEDLDVHGRRVHAR